MSQMTDGSQEFEGLPPERLPNCPLTSSGDVRREMAKLYLRLRMGLVKPPEGGVMANVLGMLAKSMEHSIRDYTDEEILAEWDRRKTERQKVSAEQ